MNINIYVYIYANPLVKKGVTVKCVISKLALRGTQTKAISPSAPCVCERDQIPTNVLPYLELANILIWSTFGSESQ